MQEQSIDVRDINLQWIEITVSNIPDMIAYADNCDFIIEIDEKKGKIYQLAKYVMTDLNIKLGSKLDDKEDIERRKSLTTIGLSTNATIWKDKWKIKQKNKNITVRDNGKKHTTLLLRGVGIFSERSKEAK